MAYRDNRMMRVVNHDKRRRTFVWDDVVCHHCGGRSKWFLLIYIAFATLFLAFNINKYNYQHSLSHITTRTIHVRDHTKLLTAETDFNYNAYNYVSRLTNSVTASKNDSNRNAACDSNKTRVLEYTNLSVPLKQMFDGKLLCQDLNRIATKSSNCSVIPDPISSIVVNMTFSCYEAFYVKKCGTGNMIQLLYAIRVTAKIYRNIHVIFTCTDAHEMKKELVLPWLMGEFPATNSATPTTIRYGNKKFMYRDNLSIADTNKELCQKYYGSPVAYMFKEIIYDFRKMAIHLVGTLQKQKNSIHPSVAFAESNFYSSQTRKTQKLFGTPLLPIPKRNDAPLYHLDENEYDDAVIHFRCGDLMNSTHPRYSLMKFSGYTRHISPDAASIGIITQPFEMGLQSRDMDSDPAMFDRCYIVVHSLVQFVQERHPKARVRIRNDRSETIALTFARMIMANQTIVGISSFSVMPAIASFGTGYIRLPDRISPNQWLLKPRIDQFVPNVVLFEEPNIIMVADLKQLWEEQGEVGVLNWFWDDTVMIS